MDAKIEQTGNMGWLEYLNPKNWFQSETKLAKVAKNDQGISEISHKKRDNSIFDNKDKSTGIKQLPPLNFQNAPKMELPETENEKFKSSNVAIAGISKRAKQKQSAMKSLLKQISEKNEQIEKLSQKVKGTSETASTLQKEASELEYQASLNEIHSRATSSVIKGLTAAGAGAGLMAVLGYIGAGAITGPLGLLGAGVTALVADSGPIHMALESYHGAPKLKAASKAKEAQTAQADVQLLKDEQSRISQEMSILQNMFSMESQSFSVFISILQTVISALNDAKRAIASSISR